MKISAKINVLNEEDNIAEVCESLDWADEIVVVDSGSTDRTVEIARKYTDKIFFNEFVNFRLQHQFADSKCRNDWIFWIDADERVSPELRESILSLLESGDGEGPAGYRIGRKAWYMGRWITHSGWYPDLVLRLYRRSKSSWSANIVHESVQVEGKVGTLGGELHHYTRRDLQEHHDVIAKYSRLAADFRYEKGDRASWSDFLVRPPAGFFESYFFKLGVLDGLQGLLIAYFRAYSVFLRTAFLWERQRQAEKEEETTKAGSDLPGV